MLDKIGKEIRQHVGHKCGTDSSGSKRRFRLLTSRAGLEALGSSFEKGSRGAVEQHGGE